MKFLLLIPSLVKTGIADSVMENRHPRMDYYVLQEAVRERGHEADILDYQSVETSTNGVVRWLRRVDKDTALAFLGVLQTKNYDALFTNGENVAIPLALFWKARRKRIGHITIGHRVSTGKKRLFFGTLKVMRQIDAIFVYSTLQQKIGIAMGIPEKQIPLIAFHADTKFYQPTFDATVNPTQICSAGLEWRDYPTLIHAVAAMSQLTVCLAAASPWSKHTNETEKIALPAQIRARRYSYDELRTLYAESAFVVVPLYDNDFQAGVTTLLEAMAMGKAVIITRTQGQTDVIQNGETGIYVSPADVGELKSAIETLQGNPALCLQMGMKARQWVENCANN